MLFRSAGEPIMIRRRNRAGAPEACRGTLMRIVMAAAGSSRRRATGATPPADEQWIAAPARWPSERAPVKVT